MDGGFSAERDPFLRLRRALLARVVDGVVHVVLSGQDQLRDGHKGVTLLQKGLQNGGQGLGGVLGGVVKEDDRPRLDFGGHPLGDVRRRQVFPVQRVNVPNSFNVLGLSSK